MNLVKASILTLESDPLEIFRNLLRSSCRREFLFVWELTADLYMMQKGNVIGLL